MNTTAEIFVERFPYSLLWTWWQLTRKENSTTNKTAELSSSMIRIVNISVILTILTTFTSFLFFVLGGGGGGGGMLHWIRNGVVVDVIESSDTKMMMRGPSYVIYANKETNKRGISRSSFERILYISESVGGRKKRHCNFVTRITSTNYH